MRYGDIWDGQVSDYPDGVVYTSVSGRRFLAPKVADFCVIKATAKANGYNPIRVLTNIVHNCNFDLQRWGTRYHPEYIDASNFGVGVYMNGAGYGLTETYLR